MSEYPKKCTKCGFPKDKDDFPFNGHRKKTGKEVRGTVCNECRKQYFREYFKLNYEPKNQRKPNLTVVRNGAKKGSGPTCKCHPDRQPEIKFKTQ